MKSARNLSFLIFMPLAVSSFAQSGWKYDAVVRQVPQNDKKTVEQVVQDQEKKMRVAGMRSDLLESNSQAMVEAEKARRTGTQTQGEWKFVQSKDGLGLSIVMPVLNGKPGGGMEQRQLVLKNEGTIDNPKSGSVAEIFPGDRVEWGSLLGRAVLAKVPLSDLGQAEKKNEATTYRWNRGPDPAGEFSEEWLTLKPQSNTMVAELWREWPKGNVKLRQRAVLTNSRIVEDRLHFDSAEIDSFEATGDPLLHASLTDPKPIREGAWEVLGMTDGRRVADRRLGAQRVYAYKWDGNLPEVGWVQRQYEDVMRSEKSESQPSSAFPLVGFAGLAFLGAGAMFFIRPRKTIAPQS